jgi:hypothetical protein
MRKQDEIIQALRDNGYPSNEAYAWAWGFLSATATEEQLNTLLAYALEEEHN